MNRRNYLLILVLALTAMILAACPAAAPAGDTGAAGDAEMAAPVTVRINLSTEPPTLDPALSTDTTSSEVINTSQMGLTTLNPDDFSAEPYLATDWSVAEDGVTWTFNVRTDVPWVKYNADTGEVEEVMNDDGSVHYVTAKDIEYGIKRTCDPETASTYAYIMYIIDGCEAAVIGEGAVDDVAATAIDDSTIEITTQYAAGFFPQIVQMPTAFAMPQWVIEEYGELWTEPENLVGSGPYVVSEWIHQDSLQMVKNPFWPIWEEDSRMGNIEVIDYVMVTEESTAFAMYDNNELDWASVPSDQIELVMDTSGPYGEEGQIAPDVCTYYYGFITQKEAVSDPNVRRALSMALDRKTLVEQVTKGGQIPANTFTNPLMFGSAAGDPDVAPWALSEEQGGIGYEAAVEQAKQLMADAGYPDGEGLVLNLGHNVSEGHAKIAQAVQAMWTAAFPKIQVNIQTQEWGVYLSTIDNGADMAGKPDVFRLAWCMDYPHANNWVHEVFNTDAGANRLMLTPDDPQIGDLVTEYDDLTVAAQTASPEEQVELYKQAEQLLVDDMAAMIPIYYYTSVRAVKPWLNRVTGLPSNPYIQFWTIDAEAQQ